MTTDKARLNVYIPQELKDRLDRLAQKDRRSGTDQQSWLLSVTVEILLNDALEALEAKDGKQS